MVKGESGRLRAQILEHAARQRGSPVRAADLKHLGSRASIDQALSRLARSGALVRHERGAYVSAGTVKAPRRSHESKASKRELVMQVAADLFAARGYYGVSMRDIAIPSGLHIATLYHYFPDKKSLYDVVVKLAWEEAARRVLHTEDAASPPRQQLEAWISNVLAFHFNRSTAALIMDRELFLSEENPVVDSDMLAVSAEQGQYMAALVTRLSPPILQHMSAHRVADIVYALSYGLIKFRPALALLRPGRDDLDLDSIRRDVLRFMNSALGWHD